MSLKRTYFPLILILISFNAILSDHRLSGFKRTIKSHPFLNVTEKDAKHLKFNK